MLTSDGLYVSCW